MGVRRNKSRGGGQKHSRDGHLSESYSQVSVSDRTEQNLLLIRLDINLISTHRIKQ